MSRKAKAVYDAMTPRTLVREDGRIERLCEHGVGHCIGHIRGKVAWRPWMDVHGCDGCCADWPREITENSD